MNICLGCGKYTDNDKYCSRECYYKKHIVSEETRHKLGEKSRKFFIDKDTLYSLYWIERKNCAEIGRIYSVDGGTVGDTLTKYGIERRSRNDIQTGHEVSNDTRQKLSAALSGKIGNRKGILHTDKVKMKISIAKKGCVGNRRGVKLFTESREKMRRAHIGVKHTDTTKQKHKDLWQNPEYVSKQMRSRKVYPNKTELKFLDILNSISPQPFKYVGDGQLIVAGKCPDYVCETNDKLLVEFYGDYWHRGQNPQDRIDLFAKNGHKTLIVWDNELMDIISLKNKIISFVGVI